MQAEVCVVGGGPAGATAAARLAALGHEVVLVERAAFPREHVGESLSPGTWPLLELLGVQDVPCLRPPSRVRWNGVEWSRPPGEGGAIVDRGAFDALLLRHAAASGAVVRESAAASVARTDGGWEVSLRGSEARVRAAFLIDASGRRRLLGGARSRTSPRTLCLHARWQGGLPRSALVEQTADCWLWGAPMPGDTFRAMAFIDAESLGVAGIRRAGLRAHYRSVLAGSRLMAALARNATIAGGVHACDATPFVTPDVIDARTARVGEAACAIDPLSSCGVQLAIQTALAAATAVHTILAPGLDTEAAIAFYTEQVQHAAMRHVRLAAGFYAGGARASASADARVLQPPAAQTRGGRPALADLLAHRVRLAPATTVTDTPCVVGDRVERRPAITNAALDRPVAFLGGHELVPLVDGASAAPTLHVAIDGWCAAGIARSDAEAVARWLVEHRVIECARPEPARGDGARRPRPARPGTRDELWRS